MVVVTATRWLSERYLSISHTVITVNSGMEFQGKRTAFRSAQVLAAFIPAERNKLI
jgi:hypothetical protein